MSKLGKYILPRTQTVFGGSNMKIPRWGELKWKPIPQVAYETMKYKILGRHIWLHYFMHCIYCVIMSGMRGSYEQFTPLEWRNKHARQDSAPSAKVE